MCKKYIGCGILSLIATWGFFTILLKLLGVANVFLNALILTILIFIATYCCPVCNPEIAKACKVKKKK